MRRERFLGVPLDIATMDETVTWIDNRVARGAFTQHVVVNVAKLVNMRKDKALFDSVTGCDLINVDGMGVVWGMRFAGMDVPERVAGVDLFHRLLKMSGEKGYSVYLLGARPEIVEKTVAIVENTYPGLKIAGFHHGYFWEDETAVVEDIRQSGAKLLFVAITSPKKENFIHTHRDALGVYFVMGVGGTFDVVAGKVSRAPLWMQAAGLEWFYRLIQEPRRMWKRYMVTNTIYAMLLIRERIKRMTAQGRDR